MKAEGCCSSLGSSALSTQVDAPQQLAGTTDGLQLLAGTTDGLQLLAGTTDGPQLLAGTTDGPQLLAGTPDAPPSCLLGVLMRTSPALICLPACPEILAGAEQMPDL